MWTALWSGVKCRCPSRWTPSPRPYLHPCTRGSDLLHPWGMTYRPCEQNGKIHSKFADWNVILRSGVHLYYSQPRDFTQRRGRFVSRFSAGSGCDIATGTGCKSRGSPRATKRSRRSLWWWVSWPVALTAVPLWLCRAISLSAIDKHNCPPLSQVKLKGCKFQGEIRGQRVAPGVRGGGGRDGKVSMVLRKWHHRITHMGNCYRMYISGAVF